MEENMTSDTRPNIFPALRCNDARAEIDWLIRAFGFETDAEHAAPDGGIAHAQLHLGAGVVGVSSAHLTPADHPWSTVRQGIYVRVADVDAHHDRAKAAGADIVMPLKDMDYGSREYSARDLGGHLWGFGTYDMAGPHPGDPNIFIGLHYSDPRTAVAWLTRAFGFESLKEVPGPDGNVMHAELQFGAGIVMLEGGSRDSAGWGQNTQGIWVYVPDPDAHFARAQQAGAKIIQAPETKHYGARDYYAHDPEGFLWGFSTYKPAVATV
jgi:uncharacterized glyoxalase superfamily protein PhnB